RQCTIIERDTKSYNDQVGGSAISLRLVLRGDAAAPGGFENETASERRTRDRGETWQSDVAQGCPAVHAILFRPLKDERELLHPSCLRLFPPPKAAVFLSEEKESEDGNDEVAIPRAADGAVR
ncbi:hypothetical protein ALC62_13848, partial [Cyphomyrmex costatus]